MVRQPWKDQRHLVSQVGRSCVTTAAKCKNTRSNKADKHTQHPSTLWLSSANPSPWREITPHRWAPVLSGLFNWERHWVTGEKDDGEAAAWVRADMWGSCSVWMPSICWPATATWQREMANTEAAPTALLWGGEFYLRRAQLSCT